MDHNKNKTAPLHPIAAGIVGAVAGAAVVALTSQDTRKKMGEQLDKIKSQTMDTLKKINENTQEYTDNVKQDVKDGLKKSVENEKPKLKKYV